MLQIAQSNRENGYETDGERGGGGRTGTPVSWLATSGAMPSKFFW